MGREPRQPRQQPIHHHPRVSVFFLHRSSLLLSILVSVLLSSSPCRGWNLPGKDASSSLSRRDVLTFTATAIGGTAYAKLVADTLVKVSRGIVYPEEHERRVESTITTALVESVRQKQQQQQATTSASAIDHKTLRIVEVGIGQDCRLIRRGLYNKALSTIQSMGIEKVEIYGVDVVEPKAKAIQDASQVLLQQQQQSMSPSSVFHTQFHFRQGDLETALPFLPNTDQYIDVVLSCLTLCSVEDPQTAVQSIHRVLRPNGGTFGFVEHVAVDPTDMADYQFLDWQQRTLDPLQQKVAHNCHLHRPTQDVVASVFGVVGRGDNNDNDGSAARVLTKERFIVDSMWPVSYQCCSVVQRIV